MALTFLVSTLLFTVVIRSTTSFTTTDFLKGAVKGTYAAATSNAATLFSCSEASHAAFKDLSRLDFPMRLAQHRQWKDALNSVPFKRFHTMIVDWQCPESNQLLQNVTNVSPYRWLLLNVTNEEQSDRACQNLASEISAKFSAFAAADADVVLVCRGLKSLTLIDLWGHGEATILGRWSSEFAAPFRSDRHPPAVRRLTAGLNGHVFYSAFVISVNDTLKHLTDGAQREHDVMTKFNYAVVGTMAKMLNATMSPLFTDTWGYYINGTWNGVTGLLMRREAEIGGTPNVMLQNRMPIQTYTNYLIPGKIVFIFKEPPLTYTYNLFTLPFPPLVWAITFGILALGATLLWAFIRAEEAIAKDQSVVPKSWSEIAFDTYAAVCIQGTSLDPHGIAGKMAFMTVLFSILFLYVAYSASMSALLQSTTTRIRYFQDFLDTPIELGANNVSYLLYYLPRNKDYYRRRVWVEKLTKHGRRNPFTTVAKGMEKVRKSYYAFCGAQTDLYQVISDTYQEHEKCGLRELTDNFAGVGSPHMTVATWSPHTELILIALRKLQERGIRHRSIQKYTASKPACENQGGNFQSVSLVDCFGLFMVFLSGLGFSLVLLITEAFIYKNISRVKQNGRVHGK